MEGDARVQNRRIATRQRRPQFQPMRLYVPFAGRCDLGEGIASVPVEISLVLTDSSGALAPWFDDWWWTDVLQRWADNRLTFQFLPTPQALLHPVVLHHVEMVQRVAPLWRIIGQVYADEISTLETATAIGRTRYHEVHVLERDQDATKHLEEREHLSVEELFGTIRREQLRIGAKQPILVRLPSHQKENTSPTTLRDPVPI